MSSDGSTRCRVVDEARDVDVERQPHRRVDRREEVVEVVRHEEAGLEGGEHPWGEVAGHRAPRDAAQQQIDRAQAVLLLDQVGAAQVEEGRAVDLDVDAVDLTAAVGAAGEPVERVAGQLAVGGHCESQQQLRMATGHEADGERADLVHSLRIDLDRGVGQAVEPQEPHDVRRPVDGRTPPGELWHVHRVVEVAVSDEHGIRLGRQPRHHLGVGPHGRRTERLTQAPPREERVDEQRRALVGQAEAGGAEPLEAHAVGQHPLGSTVQVELGEHGAVLGSAASRRVPRRTAARSPRTARRAEVRSGVTPRWQRSAPPGLPLSPSRACGGGVGERTTP